MCGVAVAAHRLLLLRLTDSRSANHMCVPPTSTSAPLSSAFTFPRLGCVLLFPLALPVSLPSLRVSTTKRTQRLPNHRCPLFSRFEERKPCPPPLRRLPLVCPASALYTLCAKPFPMHPSGLAATACNKRGDLAIATALARVHASDVLCLFIVYVYSRAPALLPPISPSPYHLYFIASFLARARASAHERRACVRANTRNSPVEKHRARAKLLRARARPFV